MEISPHWGQSHTESWGKTNPAIILTINYTVRVGGSTLTQHEGITIGEPGKSDIYLLYPLIFRDVKVS